MVEILTPKNPLEEVLEGFSQETADLKEEITNNPKDPENDPENAEATKGGPIKFVLTRDGQGSEEKTLPPHIDINPMDYGVTALVNFFQGQSDMEVNLNYTNKKGATTKVLTMIKKGDVADISITKGKKIQKYTVNFSVADADGNKRAKAEDGEGNKVRLDDKQLNAALVILKYGISYQTPPVVPTKKSHRQ